MQNVFKSAFTLAAAGVLLSSSAANASLIYGLTTDGNLFTFDSSAPQTVLTGVFISGLPTNGEHLVGIDFRPSNDELFGISSTSTVYKINTSTGLATAVGAPFTPALNGTTFDIDFNPTVDRIRLVSDADQNLRLNPNNGAVAFTDLLIKYAAGDPNSGVNASLAGAAYTNSLESTFGAPAASTTLYTIDSGTDTLNIQSPPNDGTQNTVGSLGVDATGLLGFDIDTLSFGNNVGYVAIQIGGNGYSQFGTIALNGIGGGTSLGTLTTIGGGLFVRDIAVIPEPASLGLAGLGVAGFLMRRRRA